MKPNQISEVKFGAGYNKIDDRNGSALIEDAFSRFPKPKPPPLNLKALEKPGQKRRLNTYEKDFSITEEEMFAPSSLRNRVS